MATEPLLPPCSVLLLAGGRGQRMGGRDKGLIDWQGKPLIAHVHALVRPLGDDLIISCNRNQGLYASYADRLVVDDSDDFPGPLAGIRAGLAVARHDHLLVLPCDVPGLDLALLRALLERAGQFPQSPVLVRHGEHWEPLICVLPVARAGAFEQAWVAGERSPRKIMLALAAQAVDCAVDDPRLANLNTPDALAAAHPPAPE
jgi:molybdopterin-guanine dinucleotide biosynthesis protein A